MNEREDEGKLVAGLSEVARGKMRKTVHENMKEEEEEREKEREKERKDRMEKDRRLFFTQCCMVSRLQCDKAAEDGKRELRELRGFAKRWKQDRAENEELNKHLDSLAFLLVKRPGECIAVAIVGYSVNKIELVAQAAEERFFPAACREHLGLAAIRDHAMVIFRALKECRSLDREDPHGFPVLKKLVRIQVDYSAEKICDRVLQVKKFTEKVAGFELPSWASMEVGWSVPRDIFSLPSVRRSDGEDLGAGVHRQLYGKFVKRHASISLPPLEAMMVLNRQNFDFWTSIFVGFLEVLWKEVLKLNTAVLKVEREKQIETVVPLLGIMEILATSSHLFRHLVEVITRALDGEGRRAKEEEKKKMAKLDALGGLQQPEALDTRLQGTVDEPSTSAGVMGPGPSNPTPRKRDWFKNTFKKVAPGTIMDRLTSRRGRPKVIPNHVQDILEDSSRPSSRGKAGPLQGTETRGPGGQLGRGHDPTLENQESFGPFGGSGSRISSRGASQKDSVAGSFFEEGQGEETCDEAEGAAAVLSLSTDFSILWLVSEHLMSIRSILGSEMIRKLVSAKELNLEVLPYDEEEPVDVKCESLRETLYCLLKTDEDGTKEDKADIFIAHVGARAKEVPKISELMALDTELPTIEAPIHAELRLFSHLQRWRDAGKYYYPYIGISKPPCLGCEVVLLWEGDHLLFTREGHAHVYTSSLPKGISEFHLQWIVEKMAEKVCGDSRYGIERHAKEEYVPKHRFGRPFKSRLEDPDWQVK
ncbi:hypothetical protein TWF481_003739 [Arthrobotrys musiformis]|uniref:Uncharacterized protein n=1 Tax=Arthrobotrys musiformis TaxID=47236 RepID=A0AAV9WJ17_9PEZI